MFAMKNHIALVAFACLLVTATASSQWLNHPATGIPRGKEGTPILNAAAPTTRDGRPEFSGIWQPDNDPAVKGTNGEPLPRYFISVMSDLKDGGFHG